MTPPAGALPTNYRFADLTLDVARRCVMRQAEPIELKALDFDLLRFLVESAPNVVNTDVLAEKVWGRHFVSPENVAQRVMLLRQSLADDANRPRYIETIRNKGYRLVPAVERMPAEETGIASRNRRQAAVAAALILAVGLIAAASYWFARTDEPSAPSPSSVAVLPFENSSPDPGDAYFAAGMRDEIVSQLTKISGLRVFPVRLGSGAQRSIADVGRDLNVATVLGGSVHYAEGRVRVNTHLTEAATSENLWSDSYERELSDIFAIQSDIALDVAHALSLELSAAERDRVERVPTTDPRARDLYLMARARSEDYDELLAIAEVEQALALDDEFKEAWVLNSNIRNYAQFIDPGHADEHRLRGEHAARRALQLDPELGEAYEALGSWLWSRKDWAGAEAAFRRAIGLNVPSAGMGTYAFLQLSAGKFGALARDILEGGRAVDPQFELFYRFLAFVHAGLGDWARADELYESGMRLFESDERIVVAMRDQKMHWLVGRNELAEARTIRTADPLNAAMLASLDAPEEALAQLRRDYAATAAGNPNRRRDISLWAGHFGDPALALEAMRAAIDEQGGQMVYIWLPQLAAMRKLPAFKAYMHDIGMVAYWNEYGWPPFCRRLGEHDFECH